MKIKIIGEPTLLNIAMPLEPFGEGWNKENTPSLTSSNIKPANDTPLDADLPRVFFARFAKEEPIEIIPLAGKSGIEFFPTKIYATELNVPDELKEQPE